MIFGPNPPHERRDDVHLRRGRQASLRGRSDIGIGACVVSQIVISSDWHSSDATARFSIAAEMPAIVMEPPRSR